MNLSFALIALTFLVVVGIWALYWTAWKIRNDLIDNRKKLTSDLAEIRKALENKAGKA